MKFCPKCGYHGGDAEDFCHECGASLKERNDFAPGELENVLEKRKKNLTRGNGTRYHSGFVYRTNGGENALDTG